MARSSVEGIGDAWARVPRRWLHIDLPGYCEYEGGYSTYVGFSYDDLPPIPIELDDNCDWLLRLGKPVAHALNCYQRDLKPATVAEYAAQQGIELPRGFEQFMFSSNLQSRVRSCTDCYLDPGERIVETVGAIPGHLVHFLSDSQSCAHWYLHISTDGSSSVLESEDYYGLTAEHSDWIENPACRLDKVDITTEDFACCASSFSEFLYRFWIENEIWFASYEKTRRPLEELELQYVRHYKGLKGKQ